MPTQPELTRVEAPSPENAHAPAPPAPGRGIPLPLAFLVAGFLFAGSGAVLAALREDPWVAERLERLARFGLTPASAIALGAAAALLSLVLFEMRRAEGRIAEAVEHAMRRYAAADTQAPPDVLDRFEALARSLDAFRAILAVAGDRTVRTGDAVEAMRPTLAFLQDRATKAGDGIEAIYRSVEGMRVGMVGIREAAGLAGSRELAEARAAFEGACRELKASVDGLSRAAGEEREGARALAARVEEKVGVLAERVAALANGPAAPPAATVPFSLGPTPAAPPSPTPLIFETAEPPAAPHLPASDPARTAPAPFAPPTRPEPFSRPAAAVGGAWNVDAEHSLRDAIERLKALRRVPAPG